MAAGALGPVPTRLRHENGDTHVGFCDDVFSDAGSTPAASTRFRSPLASFVSALVLFSWARVTALAERVGALPLPGQVLAMV